MITHSPRPDGELLKGICSRSPLTAIRTLTRLLLQALRLNNRVIKRKINDHECTEQIDRMELLFRAGGTAFISGQTHKRPPHGVSLAQLQQSIPRWQKKCESA